LGRQQQKIHISVISTRIRSDQLFFGSTAKGLAYSENDAVGDTVITARAPRVSWTEEDEQGARKKTRMVQVPWAEAGSRWTLDFEAFAIEVLLACGSTNAAAGWLRLDGRAVDRIRTRAVERELARRTLEEMASLGIDEKSFRKNHRYGPSSMIWKEGGHWKWSNTGRRKRPSKPSKRFLPRRARLSRSWPSTGAPPTRPPCGAPALRPPLYTTNTTSAPCWAKRSTRYGRKSPPACWIKAMPRSRALVMTGSTALKTSKAWHHRSLFHEFWKHPCIETAKHFFNQWFQRAVRSKIKPAGEVARTHRRHLDERLASIQHRITHALSESLNRRIQTIKNKARGFHHFDSF